jgi:hypothetical protein
MTVTSAVWAGRPRQRRWAGDGVPTTVRGVSATVSSLLRGAPATSAYLLALLVTTATLAASGSHVVRRLVYGASTNVHNMTWHPLYVLLASAFWVESARYIWPMALLLVAVMAPVERLLGSARTVLVFVAGHVGATVVTVAAIGVGVSGGWLPRSLEFAADVGPSYGLAAVGGLLITRLRPGWLRRGGIAALLLGLGVAVALQEDFTDAGHLIAALLGMALAPLLIGTAVRAGVATPPGGSTGSSAGRQGGLGSRWSAGRRGRGVEKVVGHGHLRVGPGASAVKPGSAHHGDRRQRSGPGAGRRPLVHDIADSCGDPVSMCDLPAQTDIDA